MSPTFSSKIGLGTWLIGQNKSAEKAEISSIEHALQIGYTLIDTAEMYASGNSEKLIGQALAHFGRAKRSTLTIVSKVLPSNASKAGVIKACEQSLRRLGCEYLDHYLLHWQGPYPYEETLEGFRVLEERGLIKHHGVSNLDTAQMKKWLKAENALGSSPCSTNQVYYALCERGVEFELYPYLREQSIAMMAYSPLGTGTLARHRALVELASSLGASAAQLALAWCVRQPNVVAIPKSVTPKRLEDNLAAADIVLSEATLLALDALFAPPRSKTPLAVI
jgi:diketogulonate reductase-like aldo/keto reductase